MNTTLIGSKITVKLAYNSETCTRDLDDGIAGMAGVVLRLRGDYVVARLADGDECELHIQRCAFADIA